jgi:hypothetical protein
MCAVHTERNLSKMRGEAYRALTNIKQESVLMSRELFTWRADPWLPCMISVMMFGWVHSLYSSSWICHKLEAEQLLPDLMVMVWSGRTGGTHRSSQYRSHLPGHSPPAKLGGTPSRVSSPWQCQLPCSMSLSSLLASSTDAEPLFVVICIS